MQNYVKYLRDILFIVLLFRLTFLEDHPIYLLFETLASLVYFFVPDFSKPSNNHDIIE
jgi:hypothetical protein